MWPCPELDEVVHIRTGTINPLKYPEMEFELFSIPGFDIGSPEIKVGSEILSNKNVVKPDDVLFSKLNPRIPRIWIVPKSKHRRQISSTEFWPLVCDQRLLSNHYLRYFLLKLAKEGVFSDSIEAATRSRSRIKPFHLLHQHIPLPPLSEQRRIVEILDQADALRKKRAEADAKAARILPALFYKMFGDPATNPKGWPVKRLGDPRVATVNPKFSVSNIPAEMEVSFVPMADVDEVWGRIVGTQMRPYSDVMRGFTPFQDNDVLFAKITPCMQNGKAAIARNLINGRGFGSTEFHILRAGPEATPEWLYALVRMVWFRKQAEASFTGTAGQQRVPADFLIRYEVACPPLDLQHAFAKAVSRIAEWIEQTEQVRRKTKDIFSLLLHRAFTGDLTTQWREAHMKELLQEMEQQATALNLRMES